MHLNFGAQYDSLRKILLHHGNESKADVDAFLDVDGGGSSGSGSGAAGGIAERL
jgi:hypothetical protein